MSANGATWHVDQLVPVTRHGRREDVWWTYGFSPIDIEDQVGGVLVVCNDVTKQHILTEQLREANLQLADETIRLRQLFHQSPGFMCILRGPQHIFEFTNASYSQLIGQRDVIGKTIREALPELAAQRFFDLLDQVYASGEHCRSCSLLSSLAASTADCSQQQKLRQWRQSIHSSFQSSSTKH